jgi:hypothetical protein
VRGSAPLRAAGSSSASEVRPDPPAAPLERTVVDELARLAEYSPYRSVSASIGRIICEWQL